MPRITILLPPSFLPFLADTSFVMQTVADTDQSRPIWPSCPSSGFKTGVTKLGSLPTGGRLGAHPVDPRAFDGVALRHRHGGENEDAVPEARRGGIEAHGPYANGNGWPAVNQAPAGKLLVRKPGLPLGFFTPQAKMDATFGLGLANTFASEFGASTFSSFESMAPTLLSKHWSVHGGEPKSSCDQGDRTNGFWKDCIGEWAPSAVISPDPYIH
jgi:hypothetical protein